MTTLRNRHVDVTPSELRFQFKGKSGKMWKLKMRDRRIARIVRQIQELPGQQLFQYIDRSGKMRGVTSSDVNEYLREIAGEPVSAKDFRTWAGTVLAAMALGELDEFTSATAAKKNVKAAIEQVAARLGNTPTICRKCYVHPQVVDTYLDGTLAEHMRRKGRSPAGLQPEEAAVLSFLKRRAAEQAAAPKRKRVKRPAVAARADGAERRDLVWRVMPAKAGIHDRRQTPAFPCFSEYCGGDCVRGLPWMPAFAGMTGYVSAGRTDAPHRRASAPHRSGGRGCTGPSPASPPSRAGARSFPRR